MNVGLGVLWRLNLDDEFDVRDVKTSCSDISCHEHLELSILEALHSDFSLVLGNVTMHNFNVLLDFVGEHKLVCILLRLSEYDGLGIATIAD